MDEKLIQRVIDIEKQAQNIHESALNEALNMPVQAEKEAQAVIMKARSEAEEEARQMVTNAQAKEECERIIKNAEDKLQHDEMMGSGNFDRAVHYVLARVIGRE